MNARPMTIEELTADVNRAMAEADAIHNKALRELVYPALVRLAAARMAQDAQSLIEGVLRVRPAD